MLNAQLASREDEDICLMLRPSNHKLVYMCDCGVASDVSIKDCRDLGALFVSHTHIDHFNQFDEIMRHQLAVGRTIVLVGPNGFARQVSARLNSYTWNLSFDEHAVVYEVREVIAESSTHVTMRRYKLEVPTWEPVFLEELESEHVFTCDAFTVRATLLSHANTDSVAYRFDEHPTVKIGSFEQRPGPWIGKLKAAFEAKTPDVLIDVHGEQVLAGALFELLYVEQGDSVGFAMDHAATDDNHARIKALMSSVQTLFIECYYHDEDRELAQMNAHSTTSASGQVAGLAGARNAVPCHFSRRYQDRLAEIRQAFEAAYLEAQVQSSSSTS